MIGLTTDDLIIIKNLHPFVLANIDHVVGSEFYKNLEYERFITEDY